MSCQYKIKMDVIRSNYFDTEINNNNMLHPDLYKYIESPKIKSLIRKFDMEKYVLRKENKSKRKRGIKKADANDAWGYLPNRLHVNKCFVGNKPLTKRGTTNPNMLYYLVNTQRLIVPNLNYNYFAGFGRGEVCFSVSLHKGNTLTADFTNSQNSRNIQFLIRTRNLFGTGNITRHSVWNNKSRYNWKSASLHANSSLVLPKLKQINFQTLKEKEKILFCNSIERWAAGMPAIEIVKNFGSSANKSFLTKPTVIVEVDGYYIRGVIDSDGSITQTDNVAYLVVTQKDPFVLYLLLNHFGVGKVEQRRTGGYRYIADYKKNLKVFSYFFRKYPVHRTDLVFKHNYLINRGFKDLVPVRKLPEYVPRGRTQLHRLLRTGVTLSDELVNKLYSNYPRDLLLYYKEIYTNLLSEKGLSLSLLPFSSLSLLIYLFFWACFLNKIFFHYFF